MTCIPAAGAAGRKSPSISRLLREVFGHEKLRLGQEAVVRRVCAGASTLAIMPTGGGKSLCYQLPGLMLHGRTLVVSPLIALMKDQCDRLNALGILSVALHSGLSAREATDAEALVAGTTVRFIFVTPERLADPDARAKLASAPVSLVTVDEAHCLSEWGHDFRPAFLEIADAVRALGSPPVLALTATATSEVEKDICKELGIAPDGVVRTGNYRPNLRYAVQLTTREDEKSAEVVQYAAAQTGSGIIYAATVKAATAIHTALIQAGVPAGLYHGKLGPSQRSATQDAFMSGAQRIMVATNAFGLGIDKPDLRFVVHLQMPAGLDAYYQESGRAGRDGEPADCRLFYQHGDKAIQQFFLANRYPGIEDLALIYKRLQERPSTDPWDVDGLQAACDIGSNKLAVAVRLLQRQRVLQRRKDGRLILRKHDLTASSLRALSRMYEERRETDRALLEGMVAYAQSGYCRWASILRHLDAAPADFSSCGYCDNCQRAAERLRRSAEHEMSEQIVAPGLLPAPKAVFAEGQAVRVKRYGAGQVVIASSDAITVEFGNGERRCFDPRFLSPARKSRPANSAA